MSELLAPSDSFRDQALGYTHAPLLRGLEAVGLSSRPIKPAVRCSPLPPLSSLVTWPAGFSASVRVQLQFL